MRRMKDNGSKKASFAASTNFAPQTQQNDAWSAKRKCSLCVAFLKTARQKQPSDAYNIGRTLGGLPFKCRVFPPVPRARCLRQPPMLPGLMSFMNTRR